MNNMYPAINLNYTSESLSDYVSQIEYGIEEEGLFSTRNIVTDDTLQERVYASAQESKLGIALGISDDRVFLMHQKAGPDDFILKKIPPDLTCREGRIMGKNAARIVKGLQLYIDE